MDQLVFIQNNRPVTDSLTVAEVFEKEHKHVMRDIRELGCSEDFRQSNFGLTPYIHPQNGQFYEKYILTEKGFTLLAMGYTGQRAMEFKERYIDEFEQMRQKIASPLKMPGNYLEALEAHLRSERDKIRILAEKEAVEQQLALQAPKVALYDVAMQAQNAQPMNAVAKTLNVGRNKLFALLREKKVLMHSNLPYQRFIDQGYFEVRQYTITHLRSGLENKTQPLVTAKGMAYIHKLLESA